MAEVPAGMYFLFIGVGIPLVILASMFLRVFLLYQVAQNTCVAAARERTFTDAKNKAQTQFDRAIASWPGITGTHRFEILIRNLAQGRTTVSTTPLPAGSIRAAENAYIARVVVNGQLEPLIRFPGSWQGIPIPGLTSPYNMTASHISYFENSNGLTN